VQIPYPERRVSEIPPAPMLESRSLAACKEKRSFAEVTVGC